MTATTTEETVIMITNRHLSDTEFPRLELVSHHLCPYVQRAVIALTEKRIAHERTYIDLADKPDWFTAISPLGKVPLLRVRAEDGGEAVLFESAVICEYLEDTGPNPLHPADPLVRARHRAWIEFASATLDAVAGFYNAGDERTFAAGRARLVDRFAWLERHLGDGPYFSGPRFALVDAAFAPLFRYFDTFERIGDFGFFAETPRVRAYRASLAARASVGDAVAEDYSARLTEFLRRRGSHLSNLMLAKAA
jgi:glutathione S-transferase